jgi:hypothetical protein
MTKWDLITECKFVSIRKSISILYSYQYNNRQKSHDHLNNAEEALGR